MDNDLDLFNKWKKTQDKKDFQNLYNHMKEDIKRASQRAAIGSNIPESAHRIWAAQSFYDSLNTFDPTKGAALKTHVYGAVQNKAKRLNYAYQNLGSMPEDRAMQVGLYQTTRSNLANRLNREPSAQEMADEMGMGIKSVERIGKEVRKDLALVDGLAQKVTFETNRDEEILDYTYYDLNPQQQVIFEYLYGRNGKPALVTKNNRPDYNAIANATLLSQSKIRQEVKKIEKRFEKNLKR